MILQEWYEGFNYLIAVKIIYLYHEFCHKLSYKWAMLPKIKNTERQKATHNSKVIAFFSSAAERLMDRLQIWNKLFTLNERMSDFFFSFLCGDFSSRSWLFVCYRHYVDNLGLLSLFLHFLDLKQFKRIWVYKSAH